MGQIPQDGNFGQNVSLFFKGQEQMKNQRYLIRVGHTKALLLKKKGPHFGQNSRPGESDPYVELEI